MIRSFGCNIFGSDGCICGGDAIPYNPLQCPPPEVTWISTKLEIVACVFKSVTSLETASNFARFPPCFSGHFLSLLHIIGQGSRTWPAFTLSIALGAELALIEMLCTIHTRNVCKLERDKKTLRQVVVITSIWWSSCSPLKNSLWKRWAVFRSGIVTSQRKINVTFAAM